MMGGTTQVTQDLAVRGGADSDEEDEDKGTLQAGIPLFRV